MTAAVMVDAGAAGSCIGDTLAELVKAARMVDIGVAGSGVHDTLAELVMHHDSIELAVIRDEREV